MKFYCCNGHLSETVQNITPTYPDVDSDDSDDSDNEPFWGNCSHKATTVMTGIRFVAGRPQIVRATAPPNSVCGELLNPLICPTHQIESVDEGNGYVCRGCVEQLAAADGNVRDKGDKT
jgi:hypothetical protein